MEHAEVLRAIRERRPLIHCLTNTVTIGRVADAITALGALPVMASAEEEVVDMVAHAQGLVLNMGTPSRERFAAALAAGRRARERQIPVVLDPVGCGSTPWRTREMRLLAQRVCPTVVRGNAPEVAALADLETDSKLRGVTAEPGAEFGDAAAEASRRLGAVVLATGERSVLSDGMVVREHSSRGASVLERVVGGGDVLSAIVCTCCTVCPESPLEAAWSGLMIFHAAAGRAQVSELYAGTFWPRFMDQLAQ